MVNFPRPAHILVKEKKERKKEKGKKEGKKKGKGKEEGVKGKAGKVFKERRKG